MKGLHILVAAGLWSLWFSDARAESTLYFDLAQLNTNIDHSSIVYPGADRVSSGIGLTLPAFQYLVPLRDGETASEVAASVDEQTPLWSFPEELLLADIPTGSEIATSPSDTRCAEQLGRACVSIQGTLVSSGVRYAEIIVLPVSVDSTRTAVFNRAISLSVGHRRLSSGDIIARDEVLTPGSTDRSALRTGAASGATDYIIVTSTALTDEFRRLAAYKNETGHITDVVLIDDVLAGQSGRDDAERLREYLKTFHQQGGRYVLLAGDETVLPVRYAYPNNTTVPISLDQLQICDLYFADLTGDWDVDNDGVWGEKYQDAPDIVPELRVGRLPINTTAEARAYVDKLIAYETNPGRGNSEYLERAFFFSSDQMRDYGGVGQHGLIAQAYPAYFGIDTTHGVELATGADPAPTNLPGSAMDTILERGYGIVNILAHGGNSGFCVRSAGINQSPKSFYGQPEIGDLKGNGRTSFYYSLACASGGFDHDQPPFNEPEQNMVQGLLARPGAGAVGFVANSRWGWVNSSHLLQRRFFDSLFAHPGRPAIDAMTESKLDYYYYSDIVYGQNFYGDPTLVVYAQDPARLRIALEFRGSDFEAAVTADGSPAGNCLVVLAANGVCLGQYVADAEGRVTISQSLDPDIEYTISAVQPGATVDQQEFIGSLVTGVDDEPGTLPQTYSLAQNYPNPFNPSTEIAFELPVASRVSLTVYNVLGQTVAVLVDGTLPAGQHTVPWCADSFASGLYLYRLEAGDFAQTRKMLLVR